MEGSHSHAHAQAFGLSVALPTDTLEIPLMIRVRVFWSPACAHFRADRGRLTRSTAPDVHGVETSVLAAEVDHEFKTTL